MNEDNAGRPAGPGAMQSLSIQDLLVRLATDGSDLIEAWVKAAVLDREQHPGDRGGRYELADPVTGRRGGALHAWLNAERLDRLEQRFGTGLPWDGLVGAELELKIATARRSRGTAKNEIVDVEAAWVDGRAETGLRSHIRSLAASGRYGAQRLLPEPSTIRSIGIMRPPDEPLWPSIVARLPAFVKLGVRCDDLPIEMSGHLGHLRVTTHLERLARGHLPTPDVLLIMSSGDDHVHLRERPDTACLASEMPCPVIVGLGRGRHGSLLHEVAFAARDSPSDALETTWRMVLSAREAGVVANRVAIHSALEEARRRHRR